MNTITVNVTEADCRLGRPRETHGCPVARAAQSAYQQHHPADRMPISVCDGELDIGGVSGPLPASVREWTRLYDTGGESTPLACTRVSGRPLPSFTVEERTDSAGGLSLRIVETAS